MTQSAFCVHQPPARVRTSFLFFRIEPPPSSRLFFRGFPAQINVRGKAGRQNKRPLSRFGGKVAPLPVRQSEYLGACRIIFERLSVCPCP